MTSDDDRIAYLAGEDTGSLDDFDQAELDDLKELLADPSLWAEPSAGLENSIVAAITADAPRAAAPVSPTPPAPVRIDRQRSWRRPAAVLGAVAAAAAVVIGVVVVTGDGTERDQMEAALPGGTATFTKFESGWRVELDVPDLPRLENGRYYQAWLKNDQDVLVAIGSFNEGDDVVLWAGVSPRDFPTITITREAADGDQASSGDRVLAAPITED